MSATLRRPALLVALLSILAVVLWSGVDRSSGAATVPDSQAVGKVTVTGLAGGTTLSTTIRSFAMDGIAPSGLPGGGGGSGQFKPGAPVIGLDSGDTAPLLLRAIATGSHLPSVTVVLYRPGTQTRLEQWTFTEVVLKELAHRQDGPPSRFPRLSLSWTWNLVTWRTYAPNGTTILASYCYDAEVVATC